MLCFKTVISTGLEERRRFVQTYLSASGRVLLNGFRFLVCVKDYKIQMAWGLFCRSSLLLVSPSSRANLV